MFKMQKIFSAVVVMTLISSTVSYAVLSDRARIADTGIAELNTVCANHCLYLEYRYIDKNGSSSNKNDETLEVAFGVDRFKGLLVQEALKKVPGVLKVSNPISKPYVVATFQPEEYNKLSFLVYK